MLTSIFVAVKNISVRVCKAKVSAMLVQPVICQNRRIFQSVRVEFHGFDYHFGYRQNRFDKSNFFQMTAHLAHNRWREAVFPYTVLSIQESALSVTTLAISSVAAVHGTLFHIVCDIVPHFDFTHVNHIPKIIDNRRPDFGTAGVDAKRERLPILGGWLQELDGEWLTLDALRAAAFAQ